MEINLQEAVNAVLVAGVTLSTFYVWKIKNEVIASKEEVIKDITSFKELYKVDEFEKYVNMSINNRKMEYEAMVKEVEIKHSKQLKKLEDEHYKTICGIVHGLYLEVLEEFQPTKTPESEKFFSMLEKGSKDPEKAREAFAALRSGRL